MTLDAAQQQGLAKVIATHIPLPLLRQVVEKHRFVQNFDALLNGGPADPEERNLFVAREVVKTYCAHGAHRSLAISLYRNSLRNDAFVFEIVPYTEKTNADSALQGAIAVRANTLRSRNLRIFLADVEAQICVVAASHVEDGETVWKLGTGFLVGSDLVLTAYHTLSEHIQNHKAVLPAPGDLRVFFDFYEGEPISDPDGPNIPARRVDFHKDWLVCSSENFLHDGYMTPLQEVASKAQVVGSLDFALIRLAEPIGLYTRDEFGGVRRDWIDIGKPLANREDDRIIIPQHPNGYPQRIDFGRYSEEFSKFDPTDTRLRYDTETENGSSGAPCFNQSFAPVGLHNAAYKPGGTAQSDTVANQAIKLRYIIPIIQDQLAGKQAVSQPAPTRLWQASDKQVILRRDTLLDWINRAAQETPAGGRVDRIYAAVGSGTNCGKTLSLKILNTARTNKSEPIVVLGSATEAIPNSAKDLVFAIAGQLNIPQSMLVGFPERPSSSLPNGSADGDKLRKWASEEVPSWFNEVLRRSREFEVDRRAEAKDQVEAFAANGWKIPREIQEAADSPTSLPEKRWRWPMAWIAFDRLGEIALTAEVKDLIAGLTGGSVAETSVPAELRRLRWLFLGFAPDFLDCSLLTPEALNPLSVTEDDFVECVERSAATLATTLSDRKKNRLLILIRGLLLAPLVKETFDDPAKRLPLLQQYFVPVSHFFESAEQVP
jgi:trypsin-like peptidase